MTAEPSPGTASMASGVIGPVDEAAWEARATGALLALLLSALAFAAAPGALDSTYSTMTNSLSEAGGQGVMGGWVARTGFVLFGFGVLLTIERSHHRWGRPATGLHLVFGVCLLLVAAYSARSWLPAAGYDRAEDMLHSVAATAMGIAYALGVVATAGRRWANDQPQRRYDAIAVASAVVLPLAMMLVPEIAGWSQRCMFAIAYLWYGREVLIVDGEHSRYGPPGQASTGRADGLP